MSPALIAAGLLAGLGVLFYWIWGRKVGPDYRMPDWVDEYEPGEDE